MNQCMGLCTSDNNSKCTLVWQLQCKGYIPHMYQKLVSMDFQYHRVSNDFSGKAHIYCVGSLQRNIYTCPTKKLGPIPILDVLAHFYQAFMLEKHATQQKTHSLFWPDENRIQQCCAADIVQGCQQYSTS